MVIGIFLVIGIAIGGLVFLLVGRLVSRRVFIIGLLLIGRLGVAVGCEVRRGGVVSLRFVLLIGLQHLVQAQLVLLLVVVALKAARAFVHMHPSLVTTNGHT